MKILLTNDDSHSSPFLEFIVEKLRTLGELAIVVPKHEQSWKGKSMSRFETLHREEIEIFGVPGWTVDGTPADCVDIGVYNSFAGEKPDLVVSGINAGLNAGSSFIFSSGTVGACFEANIAGVPALAISQAFDTETRNLYVTEYALPAALIERLRTQSKPLLDRLFSVVLGDGELLRDRTTLNVNLPFQTHSGTRFLAASVGRSMYGSCYQVIDRADGITRFEHRMSGVALDDDPNCDHQLLGTGHVTITPLDIREFGRLSAEEVRRVNAAFSK